MENDPLASALSHILNCEKNGKESCLITPASKTAKKVIEILNENGYTGQTEEITKEKGTVLKLNLIGRINNCGVIKPKFSVKHNDFEKYEKRFLLAKDFGIIIVSTNQGIMTHNDAKKKNIGGKLLAFCY